MKNKRKFKLVKKAISCLALLTSLATFSGCAKEVECSISGEHVIIM